VKQTKKKIPDPCPVMKSDHWRVWGCKKALTGIGNPGQMKKPDRKHHLSIRRG
jgi:hypothetical protein